MDEIGEKFPT